MKDLLWFTVTVSLRYLAALAVDDEQAGLVAELIAIALRNYLASRRTLT